MASTAVLLVGVTVTGAPEGGSYLPSMQLTNTSAVDKASILALTTVVGTATPYATQTSAKFLIALPPTGASAYKITGSTAEAGISLTSSGPTVLPVVGGSTVYFYSAVSTFNLRVLEF